MLLRPRRDLVELDLTRMQLPRRYWTAQPELGSARVQEIVTRYVNKLPEMLEKGLGVLLWGKNGIGKTCCAAILLKEMRARGLTGLFCEASELKRFVFEGVEFEHGVSMWSRIRSVDVLVLDDFGKGVQDSKGAGEALVDELLRHRSAHLLITHVTTNLNKTDLLAMLKPSTESTVKESLVALEIRGDDRRAEMAAGNAKTLV